jgi:alkylated DNA repair dioxygenase AlkB
MSNSEYIINIPEISCYCIIYSRLIKRDKCKQILSILERDAVNRFTILDFHKNPTLTPRTNCFYADEGIVGMNYSTTYIPGQPWHPLIDELRHDISTPNFLPDSCLVNGYIEKSDKVGKHRDNECGPPLNVVCTVSFGGTRFFKFQAHETTWAKLGKTPPASFEIPLHEGDVLYMYGNTNIYFTHEILNLRIKDGYEFRPRYSATFREVRGSKYHKK